MPVGLLSKLTIIYDLAVVIHNQDENQVADNLIVIKT